MTKILVVEDDDAYLFTILRKLRPFFHAEGVRSLSEAIRVFAENGFKAVLLDIGLRDSPSEKTVRRMKQQYPNCAIVVLSGNEDPERIRQCIRDSASSYLVKGRDDQHPEILSAAIISAIANNDSCHKAEHVRKEIENGAEI